MELGALAESGNKVLGSRTLVSVLPPALLSVIVFVLLATGAPGTPSAALLVERLKDLGGAQVALLFFGVLVVAVILQPFQIAVVQLLEGYWVGNPLTRSERTTFAQRAFDVGFELQRRRWRFLRMVAETVDQDEEDGLDQPDPRSAALVARLQGRRAVWADQELRGYPEVEARLLPTRLGNVLRAAEDRAGGRYGLLTNVVYPRLHALLPDRSAAELANATDQLDMAAHLCITLSVATLAAAGLLLPNGWRSNAWWLLIPGAMAMLAWLSYRAAVRAARGQGQLLETAFDLHRFDLLGALHYRLPDDPWSEHDFNSRLSRFLRDAEKSTRESERNGWVSAKDRLLDDDYEHPDAAPADATARRPPGPFQPFQWDWDAILGNGGGEPGDGTAGRVEQQRP
jgi:hypothetical protein